MAPGDRTADKQKYWFPAKRYGWGWGPPTAWQGWLVLAVFALGEIGGAALLLPTHGAMAFLAWSVLLCALLVAVCWAKGEPAAWRS